MDANEDYPRLDATGLADLVRRREVTPAELVDIAASRLERAEPKLAAMMERALDRARDEASGPLQGPFAGVPFLLKDNMHVASGIPYHNGSRIWRGRAPPRDSELVRRFRAAGLVVLGTTKVPELSLMPVTEPASFGRAHNPWAPDRTAGGSSGGSAAHVAARTVPMAHGTDGGGSIRIPASCCGLFGLKPTRGRTPNGPFIGEGWHGLAVGHALTRSVRDSARLLDAIAGPDPGSPFALPAPARPFAEAAAAPPARPLRVAFSAAAPNGAAVHAECRRAVEEAAGLCAELGHEVADAAPPVPAGYFAWYLVVFLAAVAQEFAVAQETTGVKARRGEVEDSTWLCRRLGHALSAAELSVALERLHRATRSTAPFFETYDVLLTPTLARPPVKHGELRPKGLEAVLQAPAARLGPGGLLRRGPLLERAAERTFAFMPFTPVWNVTGQPAASLPLRWTAEGLPIGVQAVGRFGEEAVLLSLAGQLEQARPWAGRLPPGFG